MAPNDQLILSLETAIGSGSVALIRGSEIVIENSLGSARANVLLRAIESLLQQANTQLQEIRKFAISLGPGSFTGIRVGLSTVFGFRRSLKVEIVGVSVLEAIAGTSNYDTVAAIIPIGRNMFACQLYRNEPSIPFAGCQPFVVEEEGLVAELVKRRTKNAVLVASPNAKVTDDLHQNGIEIEVIRESALAGIIGQFAAHHDASDSLEPIYIR